MTIPHLNDEALSAAIDDAGSPEETAHLAGCSSCQAGAARLAVVARAVASPVLARSAAEVDAAIAQALSMSGASSGERPGGAGVGPGGEARHFPTVSKSRGRGPARWATIAAGLAAAVVVAGGLVAISRGVLRSTGHTNAATARAGGLANGASTTPAAPPDMADRFDLGNQSDPVALARAVNGLLPLSATAGGTSGLAQTPTANARSAPLCADQARLAVGVAATQVPSLVASLRWRGQPAVVLVYPSPSGPGGRTGVVMRTADCAVLTLVTL